MRFRTPVKYSPFVRGRKELVLGPSAQTLFPLRFDQFDRYRYGTGLPAEFPGDLWLPPSDAPLGCVTCLRAGMQVDTECM